MISREPETETWGASSAQNPVGRGEIEKRREGMLPAFSVNSIVAAVRRPLDQLPDQDSNLEQTG